MMIEEIKNSHYEVQPRIIDSSTSDPYFKEVNDQIIAKTHDCLCRTMGKCVGQECECYMISGSCTADCCKLCYTNSFKHRSQIQSMSSKNYQQFMVSERIGKSKKGCACKKTKCYKHYCECVKRDQYCDVFCSCVDCKNKKEIKIESSQQHYSSSKGNPLQFQPFKGPT